MGLYNTILVKKKRGAICEFKNYLNKRKFSMTINEIAMNDKYFSNYNNFYTQVFDNRRIIKGFFGA